MKKLICCLALAGMVMSSSGCYTFHHRVGTGSTSSGQKTSDGAWFILWGLAPLNEPDSRAMAGGAANYEITTHFTVTDVIISFFTGLVTIYKQTVTVEK